MSNLGVYQWMTTMSKKVGGPVNFLLLTGTAGATIEIAFKKCVKEIKTHKAKDNLYKVVMYSKSNDELEFITGDQFRILEEDGDSILIEKVGNSNNPYFVSAEFLRLISNYK